MQYRGFFHQSPLGSAELRWQTRALFRSQAQTRISPFTVNIERLFWGRTHPSLIQPSFKASNRLQLLTLPIERANNIDQKAPLETRGRPGLHELAEAEQSWVLISAKIKNGPSGR